MIRVGCFCVCFFLGGGGGDHAAFVRSTILGGSWVVTK